MSKPLTPELSKALRQAGYTDYAYNFPLTDAQFKAKCDWNGLKDETKASIAWRYSPGQWYVDFWESLANPPHKHKGE